MSETPNDDERIEFINKLAQNADADPRKVEIPMVLQVGRIHFNRLLEDVPETPAVKELRDSDLIAITAAELERLQAAESKLARVRGSIKEALWLVMNMDISTAEACEKIAAILDAEGGA